MSRMLYITPGPHKYDLGMFDQMVCPEEEVEKFLGCGWFKTMQEAVDKKVYEPDPPKEESETVDLPVEEESKAEEAVTASRGRRK